MNYDKLVKPGRVPKKGRNITPEEFTQLVRQHSGLVWQIVNQSVKGFQTKVREMREDLFQSGCLGLKRAMELFDFSKEHKFSTYAVWWIRSSIQLAIDAESGIIHIPIHQLELLRKIRRIKRKYIQRYQRKPTHEELAKALNIPLKKLRSLLLYIQPSITYLDFTASDNGEKDTPDLHELIKDPDWHKAERQIERNSLKAVLAHVLDSIPVSEKKAKPGHLTVRNKEIFRMYFGLNGYVDRCTLYEVAKEFDISSQRVRQVVSRVLQRFRWKLQRKIEEGAVVLE